MIEACQARPWDRVSGLCRAPFRRRPVGEAALRSRSAAKSSPSELLDRVTKKGNRSRFIDQAIRELAFGRTRTRLRKLLEEEGRVNRDRDLRLAAEWAAVDA